MRPLVALLTLLSCGMPMHQPSRITVDEGLRMMGLTRHPDWVLIRPRTVEGKCLALNGTALLHEVVHASLWLAEQDPDSEHSLHDWQAVEEWSDEVASDLTLNLASAKQARAAL